MIPLAKAIAYALLFDELAVRRWLRGAMHTIAVSGVAFADQLAVLIGRPDATTKIKIASLVCAFAAGLTSVGEKKKP